jgi:hypothetical protein
VRNKAGKDEGIDVFWGALDILERAGVVEYVAHLVDADTREGEIIHPCAVGAGEPEEQAIARSAHLAASHMLSPEKLARAEGAKLWLVPVQARIPDVALLGLARLRYRARTAATAAWYDPAGWAEWADSYIAMLPEGIGEVRASFPSVQHQR